MLHMEVIAVCSQIHTKHINTVCGQNVDWLSVGRLSVCAGMEEQHGHGLAEWRYELSSLMLPAGRLAVCPHMIDTNRSMIRILVAH